MALVNYLSHHRSTIQPFFLFFQTITKCHGQADKMGLFGTSAILSPEDGWPFDIAEKYFIFSVTLCKMRKVTDKIIK